MNRYALDELNKLNGPEYLTALESLYEYSPWVVEESLPLKPFATVKALHATLEGIIYAAPHEKQLELLSSHPDLAAKIEQIAELTDFSQSEQQRAGFAKLPKVQFDQLRSTLSAYREKFHHPFILCVSEHDAIDTIPILAARLQASPQSEHIACLAQVARIGWHRLKQLINS